MQLADHHYADKGTPGNLYNHNYNQEEEIVETINDSYCNASII
jgi:hypothetical protein